VKRKLACILSLLAAAIVLGYLFFMGWLLGFLLTKYMAGKTSGKPGRIKSIIIPFGKYKVHFHHWLISSGIIIGAIILSLLINVGFLASAISYGVLGGSVFHGIYSYGDWHKILITGEHQNIENTSVYNTEHLLRKGLKGD